MQLVYFLVTLFALAIAVFALQNADPVKVRFLRWHFEASVAVVTLGSAALGALIAGGLGLVGSLRRGRVTRQLQARIRELEARQPAPRD